MAHPLSLDSVIQKVASTVKPEDNERLVTVEAKRKRAVPRRALWGEYRQYLVRNGADPRNEARVEIDHLALRDLDHQVTAAVSMQLSCPPGNEARVAEALFDLTRSPGEMLERHVERWFTESCRDGGVEGFVRRCFADRAKLQKTLADTVLREAGMQARVRVSLHAEQSLDAIRIDVPRLAVLVRDYDEEQELSLRVALEVDEENRAAAVLHFPRNVELPQLVRSEVRRHVRQHLTLQEFCTGLATGSAKDGLAAHLDQVLAPAGRRVGALVLQAQAPEGVCLSLPTEVPVRCRVHEFPEEIVIKNKVLLLLKDLARYRRAGSPPLDGWLQKKLSEAIPQLLFETRYIDLLIDFEPVEGRVKQALRAEAEAIGYEIKQFVTVPDLPPIRLRDSFPIDTVGTFETALRGVEVKLQVVVTARIPQLEKIKGFLNRHQDVLRLMEEAVHAALRDTLHGMDPERIYMRFNHSDPVRYPGERPVQDELKELVRARLEDGEFHADVIGVTIKMVETKLIERFNKLQERICPFAVGVASFHGGPAVVFRGDFRVVSVDPEGWHNFQLLQCELDEIRAQVETHLLARLQTMHSEQLSYRQDEHRALVEALVTTAASRYVATAFGLTIEVTNVRRELTGIETAVSEGEQADFAARLRLGDAFREDRLQAEQEQNRARVEQITKLLERRIKLVDVEGTEDEVAQIDAKVAALMGSLGEVRIPDIDRLRLQVLGAPAAPLALPGAHGGEGAGVAESNEVIVGEVDEELVDA
jgi:hypothetical protein